MQALPQLYTHKCDPVFDFGAAARNTVKWSPDGELILLGVSDVFALNDAASTVRRAVQGFSNMGGDMDFWRRDKLEVIGQTKVRCCGLPPRLGSPFIAATVHVCCGLRVVP